MIMYLMCSVVTLTRSTDTIPILLVIADKTINRSRIYHSIAHNAMVLTLAIAIATRGTTAYPRILSFESRGWNAGFSD